MSDTTTLYGVLLMAALTVGAIGLQRLSRTLGPKPTRVVHDPRLGELRFDPDVEAWRVVVDSSRGPLRFQIGGSAQPDERLLSHAADVANGVDAFMDRVRAFLDAEAYTQPRWAEEIRSLELEEVCLFWPKRPNDGMLYFSGPNTAPRIWRCDYVDRTPAGLGFDS